LGGQERSRAQEREFKLLKEISQKFKEMASSIDRYLEASIPVEMNIDEVEERFPKDLRDQLVFEESDQFIFVRPRGYLGTETFSRIASIVRDELKGEYVSAGKESHFRIKK